MSAPTLFPEPEPEPQRDPTFEIRPPRHDGPDLAASDQKRLGSLQERVYELMRDGKWRTLRVVADACGGSEASVSARLRDFRKPKFRRHFGNLEVERHRLTSGTWEYRVRLELH